MTIKYKNSVIEKQFDVICLGRIAVDFYGQQIGSRLEDMTTFNKYLGGSSGNVAYGTAVQGLKSSMLARVGNEQMGRFLREELQQVGCDTSQLITDDEHLTALVILGIKDQDTFPLVFYRDNCADMALTKADINEQYIASSKCLAITGTHISHPKTREAVITALNFAKKHDVRTVLDIDYRPVLWGLTSLGDGETRYVESQQVTEQLQDVLHYFDLIVGTEEEFHIAGGHTDTLTALTDVRKKTDGILVCKRGTQGCSVFTSQILQSIDDGINVSGFNVEVLNVLGAGDAFLSGLLRGYLNDESWVQACTYANACGALVVSRHGCSPAMPTKTELDYFLTTQQCNHNFPNPPVHLNSELNHLHRVTTRKQAWQELYILAFDHRVQFEELALELGANLEQIAKLKHLILEALFSATDEQGLSGKTGLLCDSTYGQSVLNHVTGKNYWIARPIELPTSRPLKLEHGNIGSQLIDWPQEHIVKCLVYYHPADEPSLRIEQESLIKEIFSACCKSGHSLLLELILPKGINLDQSEECYFLALTRFYNLGIKPDWWKLPPLSQGMWRRIENLINTQDPYCEGILILGLDAPQSELERGFSETRGINKIQGFAIGRTVFAQPSREWLTHQISDELFINRIKDNYLSLVNVWRNARS